MITHSGFCTTCGHYVDADEHRACVTLAEKMALRATIEKASARLRELGEPSPVTTPRTGDVQRARLDANRTAKPLTEIVGVFPSGKKNFYQNAESLIARPTKETVHGKEEATEGEDVQRDGEVGAPGEEPRIQPRQGAEDDLRVLTSAPSSCVDDADRVRDWIADRNDLKVRDVDPETLIELLAEVRAEERDACLRQLRKTSRQIEEEEDHDWDEQCMGVERAIRELLELQRTAKGGA